MNSRHIFTYILAATCCVAATAAPATPGPAYSVVAYLPGGAYVEPAGIMEGGPGTFCSQGEGPALFSVNLQGKFTTLATFTSPPYVISSNPIPGPNILVYSSVATAEGGSQASVFSVGAKAGTERTYAAQDVAPGLAGNLPDGTLFALAYAFSGKPPALATVDTAGKVTPFYQFPSTDTVYLPIRGNDGNYYGTGYTNGVAGTYFYKATPSGSFTKIAVMPFGTTAFAGVGLVLQGSDGNFYGIQSAGAGCSASNQHGAVYKLTPSGPIQHPARLRRVWQRSSQHTDPGQRRQPLRRDPRQRRAVQPHHVGGVQGVVPHHQRGHAGALPVLSAAGHRRQDLRYGFGRRPARRRSALLSGRWASQTRTAGAGVLTGLGCARDESAHLGIQHARGKCLI